jgi:SanA protein
MRKILGSPVRVLILLAAGVFGVVLVTAASNLWLLQTSRSLVYTSAKDVPRNEVALVLGTAPMGRFGKNPFFEGRMNAAAKLYREGRVRHLLVSGDNHRKGYDEPTAMRDALVARGIPQTAITLDYAGFRTLDSVARGRHVFGLRSATIVTDRFHQPRALFLARAHGLQAVGYCSPDIPFRWAKKTLIREIGSRVKACLDVYVLRTKPRFYGGKESLTAS